MVIRSIERVRRGGRALLIGLGLLLSALEVVAATPQGSEPSPQAAPDAPARPAVRELVLQNLTPFRRREGVAVVVPFAPGVASHEPELCVDDKATVWVPFGSRWPDGSWQKALCLFVTEIQRIDEVRLPLLAGRGAGLPEGEVTMPPATIEIVARSGGVAARVEPVRVEDLENNPLRRVELRRGRVGDTGLVVELIVTAWRDQPHAWIDVAVFFSDPRLRTMQIQLEELAVESRGMAVILRHPGRLGIEQRTTSDGSRNVLLRNRALGDGQGLRRTGVLVPALRGEAGLADDTLRAAAVAPVLGATSWTGTGAFGPFGLVPAPPPWLRDGRLRQHLAVRHRTFVQSDDGGDPFRVMPFGLARMAGQTGDQEDFGTVKLSLVAHSGLPSMLFEVEASVLQEGCRPVHFFEADGSPVDPFAHPDWVVWSGRTHWHAGVSADRLGKPVPEPGFETHGWTGKDRQHWSSNYLGAYALLTGAHWARRELENEGRLYLAGQTIDPRFTTSHSGAPRGAGRTELAAAWNVCVTDDRRVRQRMDERMDQVHTLEWHGRDLPADRVRPMAVIEPDPRQLHGKHRYWNPWQEALAAVGFAALHRTTGNPRARELAEALAINVVRHGWRVDETSHEVAMAMRWLDGAPFTAEQWQSRDETLVQWSQGTSFSEWSIGAVELARVAAERTGDAEVAAKAAEIQRRMRSSRRPPALEYPYLNGMDRFGEWDAVAW